MTSAAKSMGVSSRQCSSYTLVVASPFPASVIRLLNACTKETRLFVDQKDEQSMADFILPIAETIFDPKGPLPNTHRKFTGRQTFLRALFSDFREVISAYQSLIEFPWLARSRPRKRCQLTAGRIVTFWREAYLNELYIFSLRLDAYITRVARLYRRDVSAAKVAKLADYLRGVIAEHFGDFIEMRGEHVHQRRYEFVDLELQRIQSLEMLAIHGKVASLRKLYDHAVRTARNQNTTNFRRINAAAKDALKAVFESYNRFMLTTSGELNYPSNLPR